MQQLLAIGLGGSAGAMLRFVVANSIYTILGRNFPHGTLFVNIAGSLLMGLLTELMLHRFALAAEYRAAILVGFLGAFTTFSTFALETLYLIEEGSILNAMLNIFLSVLLCLTACWVGLTWGRAVFSDNGADWLSLHHLNLELIISFFTVCLLAAAGEFIIQCYDLGGQARTIVFVLLLGLCTISATLILSLNHLDIQLESHHLFGLFILNTFVGLVMIGSGSWLGNYIWQLKLSP